jgi:hypothetical protein
MIADGKRSGTSSGLETPDRGDSGGLERVDDIERLDPSVSAEVFGVKSADASFKAGRDE